METNLNNSEERLFDLVESKGWEELTTEELAFVRQHLSREEYTLQRNIIVQAEMLYNNEVRPLPLQIPGEFRTFTQRTIPLYQAMAAVAAVIVFFLLIRPAQTAEVPVLPGKVQPVQQAATEKEYIYDTVVRYITITQKSKETVIDTIRKFIAFPQEEQPKLLEAANSLVVPEISSEKLETRGTSMKDDNTAHLAPRIVNTIY